MTEGPAAPEVDLDLVRRAAGRILPVWRVYFRGELRASHLLPAGQTLLIANHDGGMLPVDAPLIVGGFHEHHGFGRPLRVLVHDLVLTLSGPYRAALERVGCLAADRKNLDALLDRGESAMIYPGGDREVFRPFWERKRITLGGRKGFVRQALRRRLLVTPVVSVGAHETFLVLWQGERLAERLGITRRFRAGVFPIVAGLPFGLWLGAGIPQFPLPAKLTAEVLPPIDLAREAELFLGRALVEADLEDPLLVDRGFRRVLTAMQSGLDALYGERRFPVLG